MPARSRPVPLLVAFLTGAAMLTGCAGEEPAEADAGAASSSTPASAPTSAAADDGGDGGDGGDTAGDGGNAADDDGGGGDAPPFPANTEPDTAEATADALVTVTDVRVGRHEGFDRVVFETDGTGAPGWDVRYVPEATSDGSGDPVEVAGDAVLQVVLTGAGYPFDTGVEEYPIGSPVSAGDAVTVTEVVFDGTFEGQSVAFVGTTAQTPFRVYLLEQPTRVVVEVADQG